MSDRFKIGVIVVLLVVNLGFLAFLGMNVTGFVVSEKVYEPYDFMKEEMISANSEGVFLKIDNAVFSRFADSGSMSPVLGKDATGIGFKPLNEEDIHVGDIVSFWQEEQLIVHRVIEKGIDSEGVYFVTQGDNNFSSDGKVRFLQIDSVIVAVVY